MRLFQDLFSMNRYSLIALLAAMMLVFSCGKRRPDRSLSAQEYKKYGMPDCSKPWGKDEFLDAFIALQQIKKEKPEALPRKGSWKSSECFERFISDENFYFLESDTMSLTDKAYRIQFFAGVPNALIGIYSNLFSKKQYYHDELVEFYVFGLDVIQKKLDLAYRIMKSSDAHDRKMQKGLPSVQNSFMEMTNYILRQQLEAEFLNEDDHIRLSRAVSDAIMKNLFWLKSFDPKSNDIIKGRIRQIIDQSSYAEVREIYEKVLKAWN